MAMTDYEAEPRQSSGNLLWFWIPLFLILILGSVFSVAAYQQNDLTVVESIAAGFAGVGALIVGLFAGVIGLFLGLIGALIGIVAAGGALVFTAFLIGSPIIAIILFILLMRRPKECPDACACVEPTHHEA